MGTLTRTDRPLAGHVVGVYGSGGAPWHHLAFAAIHGADARVVRAEDIEAGRLDDLDVLVVPGGGATAMAGLLAPLGEAGATAVRAWVEGGGTYLSSCAGSVLPLALSGEADRAIPTARCLRMVEARLVNTGDATMGGVSSPGVGRIVVRLDPTHRFARGLPERLELVHYNGPLFGTTESPATVRPFAWPEGSTSAFTPAERFLAGEDVPAGGSATFDRCVEATAATGLEASYGRGRAILFGSHPEFGLGPLGLGWGEGASLLLAALAEGGRAREGRGTPPPTGGEGAAWAVRRERPTATAQELAAEIVEALTRAADRFAGLAEADPGAWLASGFAPSFHGKPARDAWRTDTRAAAAAARAAATGLEGVADALDEADGPWLDDEARAEQDFGAMGLLQILRTVHAQLDGAYAALPEPARRPSHAYDLFDEHPFHLAVGSYLSAAGLTAAALLAVALLLSEHGRSERRVDALLWLDTDEPS